MEQPAARTPGQMIDLSRSTQSPTESSSSADYLLYAIIDEALASHASDIHLDPTRVGLQVRQRVDGVLQSRMRVYSEQAVPLLWKLKLWAGIDPESRRAQQGRIRALTRTGHPLELLVDTLLTVQGERATIRILDPRSIPSWKLIDLDDVPGFAAALDRPQGLLLFAGPTGSGKTTVLYSTVQALDASRLNIVQITRDSHYQLPGVLSSAPDIPVPEALDSLSRFGADVIVVESLQTREESEGALGAVSCGIRVLAGIHADNAVRAVEQLLRWEIPRWQLAGAISGVVASRLVRRVCRSCSQPAETSPDLLASLGAPEDAWGNLRSGKGCEECRGTGMQGRIALYDFLDGAAVRAALSREDTSLEAILEELQHGLTLSQRADAIRKVGAGQVAVEEALRVLGPRKE